MSKTRGAIAVVGFVALGVVLVRYLNEARPPGPKQTAEAKTERAQRPSGASSEARERAGRLLSDIYAREEPVGGSSAPTAGSTDSKASEGAVDGDAGRRAKRPRRSNEELEAAGMTTVGLYSGKHSPRWSYLRQLLLSQGLSAEASALEPLLENLRAAGVPYAKPDVAALVKAELEHIRTIRKTRADLSAGSKVFGTLDDVLFQLEFEAEDMANGEGPSVDAKLEQETEDNHRDKDLPEIEQSDADPGDDLGEPGKLRQ
jgi:hypothetical protein